MDIRDNFQPYNQYKLLVDYIYNADYNFRHQDQVMVGELSDELLNFFPTEVDGRRYKQHQINCYTPRSLALFHTDNGTYKESLTLIYYPCPTYSLDEGGTTEIVVDDQIVGVRPICNRALFFDGTLLHRATPYRTQPRFSIGIKYV